MSKNTLVGRYRRAYPRIWRHPDFQQLTPAYRNLALYMLHGPHMNRIGLCHFSIATASEDLLLGADTCRTGVRHVCQTFGWVYDNDSRVFYVPSWWRWNCPENPHVLIGNLKDLSEIPPSGLIDAFTRNLAHVPPDLHDTFIDTCRTRLLTRPVPQEQEQEQDQKQEQEPPALRAARRRKAGFEKKTTTPTSTNGDGSDLPAHLIQAAKETLKLTSPNRPLDELVDAFKLWLRHNQLGDCSTADAQSAINEQLAERRRSVQ